MTAQACAANASFASITSRSFTESPARFSASRVAGTGPIPKADDTVVTHYRGTLTDGTEFDSSYKRGEPATFPVNGVIKGWTEGLQLMSVGSKYKFYIPGKLAYGVQGSPQGNIGPNETLVFEVELLGIEEAKPQISQEALQKAFEEAMKSEGK